uniref:Uncharacterized protein n=1 Tax=Anopheles atroparvus TaxID=41427 RepID=A0AAG5CYY8_ANOAO
CGNRTVNESSCETQKKQKSRRAHPNVRALGPSDGQETFSHTSALGQCRRRVVSWPCKSLIMTKPTAGPNTALPCAPSSTRTGRVSNERKVM